MEQTIQTDVLESLPHAQMLEKYIMDILLPLSTASIYDDIVYDLCSLYIQVLCLTHGHWTTGKT